MPSPALVLIQGFIIGLISRKKCEIPERGGLRQAQDRGLSESHGTECSQYFVQNVTQHLGFWILDKISDTL